MKIGLIFIFTIIHAAFGSSESLDKVDVDGDGSIDRWSYTAKGEPLRVEEDRNRDGKIDFKTILDDKKYFKITIQDTDHNGTWDRKVSYQSAPNGKVRILTELDKNGDGLYELKIFSTSSSDQRQDFGCLQLVNERIEELVNTGLKAVSLTQTGLLPTGLGYKVEGACYKKWGMDFNQLIKDSIETGLQCFKSLAEKAGKDSLQAGVFRNAYDLAKLTKEDNISLVCSEEKYEWTGTAAHASAEKKDVIKNMNIKHPFVSINPGYPDANESLASQKDFLKDTIFHETIHNLGYMHNSDIEYPYTCATCCLQKDVRDALKDVACKICTGSYVNETDRKYVWDFVEFSKKSYSHTRGAKALSRYLKENPKSTSGISLLAYATANMFNPVGAELGKLIATNGLVISKEDQEKLSDAIESDEGNKFLRYKEAAKAVSSALYELYYQQNGTRAVEVLEKNKMAIKAALTPAKDIEDSDYVADSFRDILEMVIDDVWINNFPDKKNSMRGYDLFKYFDKT